MPEAVIYAIPPSDLDLALNLGLRIPPSDPPVRHIHDHASRHRHSEVYSPADQSLYGHFLGGNFPRGQGGLKLESETFTMQPLSSIKQNRSVSTGLAPETICGENATACMYANIPWPEAASKMWMTPAPNSSNISGQLTFFYDGTVTVYDNVLQSKAEVIMKLAAANDNLSSMKELNYLSQSENCLPANAISGGEFEGGAHQEFTNLLLPCNDEDLVPAALPLARKVSLARFLARRKQRLMASYFLKEKLLGSSGQGVSLFKARGHAVISGLCRMERKKVERVIDYVAGFGRISPTKNNCHPTVAASNHDQISESGSTS